MSKADDDYIDELQQKIDEQNVELMTRATEIRKLKARYGLVGIKLEVWLGVIVFGLVVYTLVLFAVLKAIEVLMR